MFRQVDIRRAAPHERVGRETRFEAMHTFQHKAEARIPTRSLLGVLDPEDRNQFVGPVAHVSIIPRGIERPDLRRTG
jgi:hypothetical protein